DAHNRWARKALLQCHVHARSLIRRRSSQMSPLPCRQAADCPAGLGFPTRDRLPRPAHQPGPGTWPRPWSRGMSRDPVALRRFGGRFVAESQRATPFPVGSPTLEPMGRTPRIQFSGALYHVTTRGNAKQRVCLDDWDFVALVTRIGETVMRYGWVCHSYCLLGHHFHLSVATRGESGERDANSERLVRSTLQPTLRPCRSCVSRPLRRRAPQTA